MKENFTVFVVDDDELVREVLQEFLAENFEVETFASGEACLARLTERKPDMLVVDVVMPEMDGYTLCRRLRDDFETADIPVTFISANDDIESRLSGYEVGGDDFIVKPIDPEDLLGKIRVAQRRLAQEGALREQAGYAQRTAMSAMVSMSELGVVLQFMQHTFQARSLREIGEGAIGALDQYGLEGAIQLRIGDETASLSRHGQDVPLEVSVLNHVRDSGRVFQFHTRCVFNYGGVTLLVNNMPVEDEERCGRIRDNLSLLTEGAESRLKAIAAEQSSLRRQAGLTEALPKVHAALDAVQGNYRRNCFELTEVMIQYQEALLKSFVHLGLTEDQERYLTEMADKFMQRMVGTQDRSLTIVGELEALAQRLEGLTRA